MRERLLYVLLVFLLNYPMLFALDRGNLDLYVLVFITFFLFNYSASNSTVRSLAVVSLSIAIALKIYPVLFAIIYLKDRRYRELILAACYTMLLTLGSLAILDGGVVDNIKGFIEVMHLSADTLKTDWLWAHRGSSSFFSSWRLFAAFHVGDSAVALCEHWYPFLSTIFGLCSLLFVFYRKLEFWQLAAIIVCLVTGLPTVSNDYRLTLLLPVIVLMNSAEMTGSMVLQTMFLCVAFLLVPKNIFYLHEDIGVSSMISGMILLLLLLMLVSYSKVAHAAENRVAQ
jgi:hypothetical protein